MSDKRQVSRDFAAAIRWGLAYIKAAYGPPAPDTRGHGE